MTIAILFTVLASILIAGFFIIRKDLDNETSYLDRLSRISKGEKKMDGMIQKLNHINTPFSDIACIACRWEVRDCAEKTIIDKRGHSVKKIEWNTLAEGQKCETFNFFCGTEKLLIAASNGNIESSDEKTYALVDPGMQTAEDLLHYLKSWQNGPTTRPEFLNNISLVDITNSSKAPDKHKLVSSNIYLIEQAFLDGDNVNITVKSARPQKTPDETDDLQSTNSPHYLLKKMVKI